MSAGSRPPEGLALADDSPRKVVEDLEPLERPSDSEERAAAEESFSSQASDAEDACRVAAPAPAIAVEEQPCTRSTTHEPGCTSEAAPAEADASVDPAALAVAASPEAAEAAALGAPGAAEAAPEALPREACTDAPEGGPPESCAAAGPHPPSPRAAQPAAECEEKALPSIDEEGLLEDASCASPTSLAFKGDLLKEAPSRRSNSSIVAAAARSRHPRRAAISGEDEEGKALPGSPVEWSLYIMRQVDRISRRLDNLERDVLPALQRSSFEALSLGRSQETRLKSWTENAAGAINFLGEETSARRQEVQDLQAALAEVVNNTGRLEAAVAAGAAAAVASPPPSAPGSPRRAPCSPPPAGPFTQSEVDRFAGACQRAAAEAVATTTARFEQQVAADRALLEKEFTSKREEVLQLMETLSSKAASAIERWEELGSPNPGQGIAEEGHVGNVNSSHEASPGRCGCDLGDEALSSGDERVDPSQEEVQGAPPMSELVGASFDMAVVEKSASLKRMLLEEVCQVRLELQEESMRSSARPRRRQVKTPQSWRQEAEDSPPKQGWSFWSKPFVCSTEAVAAKKPAPKDQRVILERGLWDELLGRPSYAPLGLKETDLKADEEGLLRHAAL